MNFHVGQTIYITLLIILNYNNCQVRGQDEVLLLQYDDPCRYAADPAADDAMCGIVGDNLYCAASAVCACADTYGNGLTSAQYVVAADNASCILIPQ